MGEVADRESRTGPVRPGPRQPARRPDADVAALLSRFRVPQEVILIAGGILIGPQVLGWADPDSIELVSNLGLGFLFLLAGYELELGLFRERAGRLALSSWLVTAAVAVG
jgi:Kef-type K+ transport system membrane component KefB